jgi:type II secretory pathway component PulF
MADQIRAGGTLSENMEIGRNLFPKIAASIASVGEKSGNLDDSLCYLAELFEEETNSRVKIFSAAVEPALLIVVGLAVGWLALAIVTPIYKISSIF